MSQNKSDIFFSNAEWSQVPSSMDSHDSFERANAVCMLLLGDYANIPCSVRGYCKKVWVTDKDGYILCEKKSEDKFIPSYAR